MYKILLMPVIQKLQTVYLKYKAVYLSSLFFLLTTYLPAQVLPSEKMLVESLNLNGGLPEKLLSTKTAVFHSFQVSEKEMISIQEYFQRTGIDAVAYFPTDLLIGGKDVTKAFYDFLLKREISNLVFIEKNEMDFRMTITLFNGKETVVDPGQNAWSMSNRLLLEILKNLNRTALAQLKKENLLINDFPETELTVDAIRGKRNDFYAVDMKVDMVAIPKFGDEALDKELATLIETNFPFKYKFTEPGVSEKELRKQGMLYIMCFVYTRGSAARELLGYNPSKAESAIVSVTWPGSEPQLKNIPSTTPVYKFYFKHIDSGNIFLGNKWDSDITWQQALLNNIRGMKSELRIN